MAFKIFKQFGLNKKKKKKNFLQLFDIFPILLTGGVFQSLLFPTVVFFISLLPSYIFPFCKDFLPNLFTDTAPVHETVAPGEGAPFPSNATAPPSRGPDLGIWFVMFFLLITAAAHVRIDTVPNNIQIHQMVSSFGGALGFLWWYFSRIRSSLQRAL